MVLEWVAFGCTEVGMVDGAGVGGVQSRRKLHLGLYG